jgi:hypothetical protein
LPPTFSLPPVAKLPSPAIGRRGYATRNVRQSRAPVVLMVIALICGLLAAILVRSATYAVQPSPTTQCRFVDVGEPLGEPSEPNGPPAADC